MYRINYALNMLGARYSSILTSAAVSDILVHSLHLHKHKFYVRHLVTIINSRALRCKEANKNLCDSSKDESCCLRRCVVLILVVISMGEFWWSWNIPLICVGYAFCIMLSHSLCPPLQMYSDCLLKYHKRKWQSFSSAATSRQASQIFFYHPPLFHPRCHRWV